jgi:fatty-acyl-CoA synthase
MNSPIYTGATIVLLPRWDREVAAQCIDRYKITSFSSVPTMIVDFLANPNLHKYDISSIKRLNGGGTAMPEAIAQKLQDMGINFVEGYGLSETIAASHINPPDRPKKQCLGIPIFGVDSRVLDPNTLQEVPQGETGEIFTSGPQVFKGYWNNPVATKEALIEIDGKTFLKTGDLGKVDEDGYFFMVDRLKRMINASGYKVWPAEVELMLYQHPAIQESCIIAAKDQHRGETVKALIVLKPEFKGKVTEQELLDWAHEKMAAYKAPKLLEFIDQLPKSGSGKIQWRILQEQELAK